MTIPNRSDVPKKTSRGSGFPVRCGNEVPVLREPVGTRTTGATLARPELPVQALRLRWRFSRTPER